MPDPVDLIVCVTCQRATTPAGSERLGKHFYNSVETALTARHGGADIRLKAVECLAVCTRACTVTVAASGKWTYVIGDLDAGEHMGDLLTYLDAYAANEHGTPTFSERPMSIRRGTIARIPPLQTGDTPPTPLASRRPLDGNVSNS